MDINTYLLTSIASFTGVIAGYFISMIAPEELHPGRRYLGLFRHIRYAYPFTGILLFFFRNSPGQFAATASLLFILGLPVASYDAISYVRDEKIRGKSRLLGFLIFRYIWFIPIALLPFLFSKF